MSYRLEDLKPLIRSMVMSHRKKTLCVQELQRDFLAIEGVPLPHTKLGFATVFDLLHSMPDIVQVSARNGIPIVTYVSAPATQHVEQLIERSSYRQKKGRYVQTRYSPSLSYLRNNVAKSQQLEKNVYPATAEMATPQRPIVGRIERAIEFHSNSKEPAGSPPKKQPKEGNEALEESCEHVDGSVMSWKPYRDMWDSVNMIDLSPDVMGLSHTIEKANVAQYFSEKSYTQVRILHVLNPNRIWLRSVLQATALKQLQIQMQECYLNIGSNEWCLEANKVQHGMYCAARIRDVWHRARIVGPLMGTHVKLFYIDTGLTELEDYRCVKLLFSVFGALPAQAIRASLACLIPKDNAWTRAETDTLSAILSRTGQYLNGQHTFNAYTLNINQKLRVLDVILKDSNNVLINEQFAAATQACWTGNYYLSLDPDVFRNKRRSFNEKHPSFFCIEEGHFPTVNELRSFAERYFDYEELYTRMPHFEKNGVVEKVSREINEKMTILHGIECTTDL